MFDIKSLPSKPGVYKFFNKQKEIIYIGKAKDLKKRVTQYFKTGSHKSEYFKSLIFDVEYVLTKSETEALLLEINLIKTHKPQFNVIFKDDKSYPYICLLEKDGNLEVKTRRARLARLKNCFGPFPAGSRPASMAKALSTLYKLRKCKQKDQQRCIYNQLDQCLHLNKEQRKIYNDKTKKDIINFFNGKDKRLKDFVLSKIKHFSKIREYELALKYKELLLKLNAFQEKHAIYQEKLEDADYIAFIYHKERLSVFILHLRAGRIINTFSKRYDYVGSSQDAILNFIITFYQHNPSPNKIYIKGLENSKIISKNLDIEIIEPKIGSKKKLLNLAWQNCKQQSSSVFIDKEEMDLSWKSFGKFLGIEHLSIVELYDASHIKAKSYVGAKVSFSYGKYKPSLTRKYDLSILRKANDTKAMQIMIDKRFNNKKDKIDLIIVDGGISQINYAKAMLDALKIKTKVVGLAKDLNHKTKYLVLESGDKYIVNDLPFKNLLLKMQNQVHKSAISYHKQKRSKSSLKS